MWIHVPSRFCPSAQESGDSTSASSWRSQLLASSAASKGKSSPAKSWLREWTKEPWMKRLFGRICEPSTAALGVASWIASLPASPASRSAGRADGRESSTTTGSGTTCCVSCASPTPTSSSARTWTPCGPTADLKSLRTLPHAFIASQETCSPHAPSEPRILARDSSFSPQNGTAFTTPCADDTGLRKKKYGQGGKALSLQVRECCWHNEEPAGQNPAFTEALMGWPQGWSSIDSGPSATESCRLWLLVHGESCCTGSDVPTPPTETVAPEPLRQELLWQP